MNEKENKINNSSKNEINESENVEINDLSEKWEKREN